MSLKERWNAAETKAGKLLMRVCAIAGVTIATVGEYAEYAHFIPEGFIPVWLKGIIGVCAIVGVIHGKLTVNDNAKKLLIIFGLSFLFTSCVTYNKCYEKFGTLQDSAKMPVALPIDTTLRGTTEEDSLDVSINLDTLCANWKTAVEQGFNDRLTDTVKAVSKSGKLSTKYWIDQYNRLLKIKSEKEIDTVYIPYKDTVKGSVNCPPVVWFDPLDKLPWYALPKLWDTYKFFAAWALIAAVITLIIYLKFKPSKTVMYVEKDNSLDH